MLSAWCKDSVIHLFISTGATGQNSTCPNYYNVTNIRCNTVTPIEDQVTTTSQLPRHDLVASKYNNRTLP